jgi:hypothetical protein
MHLRGGGGEKENPNPCRALLLKIQTFTHLHQIDNQLVPFLDIILLAYPKSVILRNPSMTTNRFEGFKSQ